MPKNTLSYPKVCKRKDGKYYVDFKLNNRRYRLFSGRVIGSSINPNSYPAKLRYSVATTLAKQTYNYIVSNNYSLKKTTTDLELFNSLVQNKLSEPLSVSYRNTLKYFSMQLRNELKSNGQITVPFLDSIPLKYSNSTSFNTVRRHLNVIVNYLHDNGFPITLSKLNKILSFAGSTSNTSKAAPATCPLFKAAATANSSMRPPRAQLIMRTPFLVLFSASAHIILRVASVSGV